MGHFGSVRHATALVLLGEEPAHEHFQPFGNVALVEAVFEGLLCHEANLVAGKAVAQEIVDEEVVQFVWSDLVFGLLCNLAVVVGR